MADDLWALTATALAGRLARGEVTATAVTESCLARIAQQEPLLKAFAHLDPQHALAQARELDRRRQHGLPGGPLFGLPVGLKDIIDTADQPTEWGTPLYRGRRPRHDATVVRRLRAAGAVILGKTVTTEFAFVHPGPTLNPRDPKRTPGGSSSGSAAGVAAGLMPLALGTQTNGSMIRPASFCGVFGFKPSFGLVSRAGVLNSSPTLDQMGWFARDLADIALLADVLVGGEDPLDPATRARAAPDFRRLLAEGSPLTPSIAVVRGHRWAEMDADGKAAFEELAGALGPAAQSLELPAGFAEAWEALQRIMFAEIAQSLSGALATGAAQLSEAIKERLAEGRRVTAVQYLAAQAARARLLQEIEEVFAGFDAILTPAAKGQAPLGLGSTGDPLYCTTWSLLGLPAISLPLLAGAEGLPIGAQLVGAAGDDARLLRHADWLVRQVTRPARAAPKPAAPKPAAPKPGARQAGAKTKPGTKAGAARR